MKDLLCAWLVIQMMIVANCWFDVRLAVETGDKSICESMYEPWTEKDRLSILIFPLIVFARGVDTDELCGK